MTIQQCLFMAAGVSRATLSYTFSANTANASLNVASLGGYVAGKSDITITVNSGIYLYSTSTSNAGLTLTGGTTGDTVKLVNNGYIMGQGGNGGNAYVGAPAGNATSGGTALSLGFNTTVDNTNASAYIGGGGGGGAFSTDFNEGSGGGAGGGAGGGNNGSGGNTGGAGGSIGSVGGTGGVGTFNCCGTTFYLGSGGGGGRIFPGSGGAGGTPGSAGSGGGAGGGGGGHGGPSGNNAGASGGSGSSAGTNNAFAGAGGGGWGASGGTTSGSYPAGAGGKAVALNGKTVTWVSGNTTRVYGAVA